MSPIDQFLSLFDLLEEFERWHNQDDWSLEFQSETKVRLLRNGQPVEGFNSIKMTTLVIKEMLESSPF